jgi:energy-converting hydrogenase Eha subunit E
MTVSLCLSSVIQPKRKDLFLKSNNLILYIINVSCFLLLSSNNILMMILVKHYQIHTQFLSLVVLLLVLHLEVLLLPL